MFNFARLIIYNCLVINSNYQEKFTIYQPIYKIMFIVLLNFSSFHQKEPYYFHYLYPIQMSIIHLKVLIQLNLSHYYFLNIVVKIKIKFKLFILNDWLLFSSAIV